MGPAALFITLLFLPAIVLSSVEFGPSNTKVSSQSTLSEINYFRVRYQPRHVHLAYDGTCVQHFMNSFIWLKHIETNPDLWFPLL
jgi:hypothetical protein